MAPAIEPLRWRFPGSVPVKIWLVSLAPHTEIGRDTLSTAERARAARFSFERDRARYVASHVALRSVLSAETSLTASGLMFETGPFGKPFLPAHPKLQFNLSHSGDVAVIACTSETPVGVDVEVMRAMPDALDLARQHAPADEVTALQSRRDDDRLSAFFLMWTRREACLKALGVGFSMPLKHFAVGVGAEMTMVEVELEHRRATLEVASLIFGTMAISVAVDVATGRSKSRHGSSQTDDA